MPMRTGTVATLVAVFLWTAPAVGAPPQPAAGGPPHSPPTKYAVMHPSRPTPHKSAIDRGMSLENECLNALRATRTATPRAPSDTVKRDAAALHLDRAESAARAGRGQLCQDELALAADSLQ